ncbi:MAG: DUF3885 domain-containing protein [Clostridia bacterium]|nr:DUF3885 domain-containing protein [Clostridia bacterium]
MKKKDLPILGGASEKISEEKAEKFPESKILKMILDKNFAYLPPYFYNNPYALRCELGVGESNKEYVKNAYKRAEEIYDILFPEPPEAFFFDHYIYDCSAWEEMFIKNLLKSEEKELKFISRCYKKYEHTVVFDVPREEELELARENRIVCYLGGGENKPLKKWIDMQFAWTEQRISLVSCKNDFIFTIYDDRGCDIVFAKKEKMREYFPKLEKYLLAYDMEEMKKRIGE